MKESTGADVKSTLSWGRQQLSSLDKGLFPNDEVVLLEAAAQRKRFELFSDPSVLLDEKILLKYTDFIAMRRRGMPVDYIIGNTEFMSLSFSVDQNVLIPRRETEVLVERALRLLDRDSRVLEIGTGSGNIAVSIASYAGCRVYASDISPEALRVARENADKNRVSGLVVFLEGDMFEPVKRGGFGDFDMIVSNPPYVKAADIDRLQTEVSCYEPRAALDGGDDGLRFYRAISTESSWLLRDGGTLLVETGYDQAAAVRGIFEETYQNIRIFKDYSSIERAVEAVKEAA